MQNTPPYNPKDLRQEHLFFNPDHETQDDPTFEQEVTDFQASDTLDKIIFPKGQNEVTAKVKKGDHYPIYTILDRLTSSITFKTGAEHDQFIRLLGSRLSMAGLSTYTAFAGDTFTLRKEDDDGISQWVLDMELLPYEGASQSMALKIHLNYTVDAQQAEIEKQTENNYREMRKRLNQRITPIYGFRGNEEIKQVLSSDSIAGIRQALYSKNPEFKDGFRERRAYWEDFVLPNLEELEKRLSDEVKETRKEMDELEKEGLAESLNYIEESNRVKRLFNILANFNRVTNAPYTGTEDQNKLFIEFYRYGLLDNAFADEDGTPAEAFKF